MTAESVSVSAIIVAAGVLLGSAAFAFVNALRIGSRLKKISASPAFVAATRLPTLGERIATGAARLQAIGGRFEAAAEQLTAARDASTRLHDGVESVAACIVGLLDVFVPSMRGRAS